MQNVARTTNATKAKFVTVAVYKSVNDSVTLKSVKEGDVSAYRDSLRKVTSGHRCEIKYSYSTTFRLVLNR